jgi:ribosome-associated protein
LINEEGVLMIAARQLRAQECNRQDALDGLIALIQEASEKPKVRRRTKPLKASRERLMAAKRRRGRIKQMRRSISVVDE